MAAGIPTSGVDAVGEAIHQYTILPGQDGKSMLHGLSNEEIVERIPKDTEIVGMACMFSVEWPFLEPLIELIRGRFPHALIVVGGEHVTACPEFILKASKAVDVCVLGEGEETFVEIVKAYAAGRPLNELEGLCIRSNGEFLKTGRRKRIQNIDDIPDPVWDIFPIEKYIDNGVTHGANLGRCMPIMASRGCPYECTFCSSPFMWTRKWSVRDAYKVLEEMKRYIKKYNVTNFDFYDLTAIIKKEWIIEFCQLLIKEDLNITWQLPSGTRSEAIDDEVCRLLYASGCRHMSYAPESGSPDELKRIKKRVLLDRMLESMKAANRAKIKIKCNFIFALPGQTWRDVFKTYGFIAKLAKVGVEDISAFPYSPYPGTEIFANLVKAGKLALNDAYFKSLSGFTDFSKGTSFNETFHPKLVGIMTTFTMMYFYTLACVLHPERIVAMVRAVFTKDTSTRLLISYSHVLRKAQAHKKSRQLGQQTVIIEPTIRPKAREAVLHSLINATDTLSP